MKFGQVEALYKIDFALPKNHSKTKEILNRSHRYFSIQKNNTIFIF